MPGLLLIVGLHAAVRAPPPSRSNGGTSMQCLRPDGVWAPCGPGNDQCGPALKGGPQFHITDRSCGMNDPNGPFYDAVHGVYHLFYQDHLWGPMPDDVPTGREGPVWGHAVSRDMAHWAHVPVGLWNGDGWYDMHGIFTGSATIVEELGGPVLTFPGVCDVYPPGSAGAYVPGCKFGYAFGVAVPANRSDPLLREWRERGSIVNDTFDDPSTAWKTPSGDWRMIGHCGDGTVGDCGPLAPAFQEAPIWASSDGFQTWKRVGFTNLPAGECASLYPLPPLVEGTTMLAADGATLTHVHKWGCGWLKDCYALGSWIDGRNGSDPGLWTTAASSPPPGTLLERGIHYGNLPRWLEPGSLTEPHDVTDVTNVTDITDIIARADLSLSRAMSRTSYRVVAGGAAVKDFWDSKHGRRVNWGWAPLYTNSLGMPRNVEYDPRLEALVFSPLAEQALLRNGTLGLWDGTLARGAQPVHIKASPQSEAKLVFQVPSRAVRFVVNLTATLADGSSVLALSFHIDYTPPPSRLEAAYHAVNVTGISTATPPAGQDADTAHSATGGDYPWVFTDKLRLVPGEETLTLRLYFDHTIAEVYWQDRVAMTLPLSVVGWHADGAELLVLASEAAPIVICNAQVWSVGSMWVTPQRVLNSGTTGGA